MASSRVIGSVMPAAMCARPTHRRCCSSRVVNRSLPELSRRGHSRTIKCVTADKKRVRRDESNNDSHAFSLWPESKTCIIVIATPTPSRVCYVPPQHAIKFPAHERVVESLKSFEEAFGNAEMNPTAEAMDRLRAAADELMRATARVLIEVEELRSQLPNRV